MRAVILPGRAVGALAAPPSKSMAHRLLICAGLAQGTSLVRNLARSEDILATVDCLAALGAELRWEGDALRVRGCDPAQAAPATLACRESGSTLRFLLPLCLLSGRPMRLRGSAALLGRPLAIYEDICQTQGLRFERAAGELLVEGKLAPGDFTVPGGVSSQFVSGLLFALPLLPGPSVIHIVPPVESRPYLDLTVRALNDFGIAVRWLDETTLTVPGGAVYASRETTVEGDYSNAAFFAALNCLGGAVEITGLRPDSLQGDRVYPAYFAQLEEGQPALDLADCPDLAPVIFAVAAACHGARFTGTQRLRYKESDRGEAMAEELAKFGCRMVLGENEITVRAGTLHAPDVPLSSHNDHRVAMALAVLCAHTGGAIDGAEAVRKSMPDFWEKLKCLGVVVKFTETDEPTDGLGFK